MWPRGAGAARAAEGGQAGVVEEAEMVEEDVAVEAVAAGEDEVVAVRAEEVEAGGAGVGAESDC